MVTIVRLGCPTLVLAALLGLFAGCASAPAPAPRIDLARTPPPPPPPVPAPSAGFFRQPSLDGVSDANGIYLVRRERRNGWSHLVLVEVWRHDPALGPEPRAGDDMMMPHPASAALEGSALELAIKESAPFSAVRSPRQTDTRALPAFPLGYQAEGLARIRAQVLARPPAHPCWPTDPAQLASLLARASGIYLGSCDGSDLARPVVLTEVLRHDAVLGAVPLAGTTVSHAPGIHGGAILILVMAPGSCPGWDREPVLLPTIGRGRIVPELALLPVSALRRYVQEDASGGDRWERARRLPFSSSREDQILHAQALILVRRDPAKPDQALVAEVLHFDPALGPRPEIGADLLDPSSSLNASLDAAQGMLRRPQAGDVLVAIPSPGRSGRPIASASAVMDGYIPALDMNLRTLRERLAMTGRSD